MDPMTAIATAGMVADKGTGLYDKLSEWGEKHGWDMDAAIGDIAERLKDTTLNTVDGMSEKLVKQPDITDIIKILKETPYEDGDFAFEVEVNDDGNSNAESLESENTEANESSIESAEETSDDKLSSVGKSTDEIDGEKDDIMTDSWKDMLQSLLSMRI